jgi:hypothetical protein
MEPTDPGQKFPTRAEAAKAAMFGPVTAEKTPYQCMNNTSSENSINNAMMILVYNYPLEGSTAVLMEYVCIPLRNVLGSQDEGQDSMKAEQVR